MTSPLYKKWDRYDSILRAEILKVHKRREPHVRLVLAIMLQAALDKDFDYLNTSNRLFQLHCKLGALVPKDVEKYLRSI